MRKQNLVTSALNIAQSFAETLKGALSPNAEIRRKKRLVRRRNRLARYARRNAAYPYSSLRQRGRGGVNHPSILRPRSINPLHWSGKAWAHL